MMKIKIFTPLLRQYALVLTINLSIVMTGMSLAWSSPMLIKLMSITETPLYKPATQYEGSWIVSLGYLIAAFTNVIGSYLLDKMGRKFGVLLCTIFKLSMALFLIFVTEFWMVLMARTVILVFDCYSFVIVPVYASEIASKTHRGSLGTLLQVFSCLGIVITLSAGPFLSYHMFSYILFGIWAFCSIPLICLPESPYYEFTKGNHDAAFKTLLSIRGSENLAEQEMEEYKNSTKDNERVNIIMFLNFLKEKTVRKSLLLTILLMGGSQVIGFNAVTFYLQTILISTNTNVMPEVASVIIGLIQLIGSLSVTLLSRIFKRKLLLIVSLGGIFVGLVGLGVFFQISSSQTTITGALNFLPITSLIIVVFCFNAGIGSLMWPISTELFEGPARAFGTAIGLFVTQLVIFIILKYFSLMTSALGPAPTYWLFSANCIIAAVLITIFLPETKDKSFQEIQKSLGKFRNNEGAMTAEVK